MSHFTVMAIIRKGADYDLEELMAPYDENMEVAPYVRRTKAEIIARKREEAAHVAHDIKVANSVRDEAEYQCAEGVRYRYGYVTSDEGRACAALVGKSDDEVFEAAKEDYGNLDEDGNYVSTYNPDSKWDWYEVGGRWDGSLILKEGGSTDEDYAGQIDWDAMFRLSPERREYLSAFWDEYVLGKLPAGMLDRSAKEVDDYLEGRFGFIMYKREYYLERYEDKEEYLRRMGTWTTYAVLDENGWHAPGEMGWFGCSDETAEAQRDWEENFRARFVDTLDPEDTVVIVDCHI